jgi:hypothetical protein
MELFLSPFCRELQLSRVTSVGSALFRVRYSPLPFKKAKLNVIVAIDMSTIRNWCFFPVMRLSHRMYLLISFRESTSHKIANLLLTSVHSNIDLTVLWGSSLSKTNQ